MVSSRLRGSGLAGPREAGQASTSLWSYGSRTQGWFFLALGSISFFSFVYATVVPKFLPGSQNQEETTKIDRYYSLLVPLTLPILLVAIYFHWLSMMFFKHA